MLQVICEPADLLQVDLQAKTVKTLAGNGWKGDDYNGGKTGKAQLLNSPWDLAMDSKVPAGLGPNMSMNLADNV